MKLLALILSFFLCFTGINAQNIDSVKHIVVVTKLQDNMALINNDDINVINKVFYERNILDSLNIINDTIIRNLNLVKTKQDTIILNQQKIIQNDSLIKQNYQLSIDKQNKMIQDNKEAIKSQKTQKTIWQSATGLLAIVLVVVLLI